MNMSKKKGMILLSGYAKSIGLSIEETRALLRKPEYREFYNEIGGKEFVSLAIDYKPEEEKPATDTQAPETATSATDEQAQEVKPAPAGSDSNRELELLKERIEKLEAENAELKQESRDKDKQIADFALKFAELAQQAQIIVGQAQILQASDKKKELEAPAMETSATEEEPKKVSFFRKLFGRG